MRCAALARDAGYDGVEVMGSEGYFINEFLAAQTNHRTDEWGGSYENRMRLPVEIVSRIREKVGRDFIVIYRLSMLDLVPGGSTWDEVVTLAKAIERAGATIINTGIGWHEARVPTIATSVPRAAFAWVTKKLKGEVSIPLCTTNRINDPAVAEQLLRRRLRGHGVDGPPAARRRRVREEGGGRAAPTRSTPASPATRRASTTSSSGSSPRCLVNPRACHETELVYPARGREEARRRGRRRARGARLRRPSRPSAGTRWTSSRPPAEIGGQFNMAKRIPGKEEFHETIRYFRRRLEVTGVRVHLGRRVAAEELEGLRRGGARHGRHARATRRSRARDDPRVLSYVDVLRDAKPVGKRVASWARGASASTWRSSSCTTAIRPTLDIAAWRREWGVGDPADVRGGVEGVKPQPSPPARAGLRSCSARRRSPARASARRPAGSTAPRSR